VSAAQVLAGQRTELGGEHCGGSCCRKRPLPSPLWQSNYGLDLARCLAAWRVPRCVRLRWTHASSSLRLPVLRHIAALQEHIELVRDDFKLVFKDIMDRDHFEDKVYFRDPITTNLNSFRGALLTLDSQCPLQRGHRRDAHPVMHRVLDHHYLGGPVNVPIALLLLCSCPFVSFESQLTPPG